MNATAAIAGAKQAELQVREKGGIRFFQWLTESVVFQTFILLCIIANAAALGIDAHFGADNPWRAQIEHADSIFLTIFTIELVLEFLAQGPKRYIRNGWNIFDVIVVGVCYVATNPAISALRTLRVVRVFRLISAVPQMRRVVEALFGAMPGILATFAVLSVVFYIGAVMGTTLFHDQEGFRNLGESALTLFQLTQFDGWGDTVVRLDATYPWAWAFIMTFTVIAAFAVLNLFIGVIVDAVQATRDVVQAEIREDVADIEEGVIDIATAQEDAATVQKRILEELTSLRREVAALKGSAPPSA